MGSGPVHARFTRSRQHATVSTHTIDTKFGRVAVKVHQRDRGWLALLTGRHLVPAPPPLEDRIAETEDEAVRRIADAIDRLEPS